MPQTSQRSDEARAPLPAGADLLPAEYAELVAENLEYMALLSRHARTLGLLATLDLEPLYDRIVETLCFETRATAGLLWLAGDEEGGLRLVAARSGGAAAPDPREWTLPQPPRDFDEAGAADGAAVVATGGGAALVVRLRYEGRLLAVARVADPVAAPGFGARELAAAEQVADAAAPALGNALRLRAAERRSLRDPRTRTCTPAFFDALVATELEKGLRFGRQFSLVEGVIARAADPREGSPRSAELPVGERFVERLQQVVRSTDLCAADGDGRFRLLLAETDALGAAVLEWRARELARAFVAGRACDEAAAPLRLASATFPADGSRLGDLRRRLEERLDDARHGLARDIERTCRGFTECRQRLMREAIVVPPRLPEQALRFALEELRRNAGERALVWLSPGAELHEAALEELARMRGHPLRAQIVFVGDEDPGALAGLPVTWLSSRRAGVRPGFVVLLGETPAYAWLRDRDGEGAPLFHSSDRALVSHLAFELQRDLGRGTAS